jgi:hypothetical protein
MDEKNWGKKVRMGANLEGNWLEVKETTKH